MAKQQKYGHFSRSINSSMVLGKKDFRYLDIQGLGMWIQNTANYNILDTFQYKQGYPGPIFKVKFKIKTITSICLLNGIRQETFSNF